MKARSVTHTIEYGRNYYRKSADGTWEVLGFGSFGPNERGLRHGWINIPKQKVPLEAQDMACF